MWMDLPGRRRDSRDRSNERSMHSLCDNLNHGARDDRVGCRCVRRKIKTLSYIHEIKGRLDVRKHPRDTMRLIRPDIARVSCSARAPAPASALARHTWRRRAASRPPLPANDPASTRSSLERIKQTLRRSDRRAVCAVWTRPTLSTARAVPRDNICKPTKQGQEQTSIETVQRQARHAYARIMHNYSGKRILLRCT